jgi:hypothetical protein
MDSGPRFTARTAHSTSTIPVRAAAHRNWRRAPARGIATMHPAKKSQIAVCRNLIPTRTGIRSDGGLREKFQFRRLVDSMEYQFRSFSENWAVPCAARF